ncbi:DNA topoisomerase 2-alpha [Trichinella spiralis]|uniref:DNA topoisomerase 2-alpha n=1 Tax=Trichinella spiralis TaxID=6334 RepID=UPI0001EFC074|nr:DNA topoisomerase 2-alpha [Trichinella spiralis]
MNADVNKERKNKHAYLVSSALPGWSDACQIKSLSDPSSEPLLVRNYCARRTIGTKAWAANEIQIYALWLPTRIISNDYIIYRAYTELEQRRIMHICHRENLNWILMKCFFLYKLGSSIQGMDGKQLLIPLWYNLESTIHAPGSHGCQQSNVGTRRNYQYMFQFTSYKLLMARNTFTKQMNSEGKNKETMNKHAYLLSSANALVRTQNNGSKSMAANEKQIYPLCLPTRLISNDYVIYRVYTRNADHEKV